MEQKTTQPSMRRTNMYFTAPQVDKLSTLSAETGLSVAELVRRAVDDYLRRNSAVPKTNNKPKKQARMPEAVKPAAQLV